MLIGLEVISVWWLSVIVLSYRFINAFIGYLAYLVACTEKRIA